MTQNNGLSTRRVEDLIRVYREGLLRDVVPFWIQQGIDREHGGIITSLNRDGSILDTDKGVWQQGRAAWLWGTLYNQVEKNDLWLQLAKTAVQFLDQHCFDSHDGRMYFHVTRDGLPLRKRRYAFSEAFASMAYAQLAKATGDAIYSEKASTTFERFLDLNNNPNPNPKFTETRPIKSIGFPMITIVVAQQLRESIGWSKADEVIDQAIASIRNDFMKHDLQCVMESIATDGQVLDHFDGRTLNPGHAIEGAWFIMQEGKIRGDADLIQTGCQMLDWMWERGWDREHGGMLYFVDLNGLPVQEYWHDMKFWWPQNETIIATLLAYQLTGDAKYAKWHTTIHDWVHDRFPDPDHGEWYGYLHRDGRISVPLKGNMWKGPFHIPRMQLVCWKILEEIQQARSPQNGTK